MEMMKEIFRLTPEYKNYARCLKTKPAPLDKGTHPVPERAHTLC